MYNLWDLIGLKIYFKIWRSPLLYVSMTVSVCRCNLNAWVSKLRSEAPPECGHLEHLSLGWRSKCKKKWKKARTLTYKSSFLEWMCFVITYKHHTPVFILSSVLDWSHVLDLFCSEAFTFLGSLVTDFPSPLSWGWPWWDFPTSDYES